MAVTLAGTVGRDEELAAVAAFLDGELPAALLLQGEAGIGKTTVWRAGLEQAHARDMCVLVSRPAKSEARLSFAGLADLLEPALGKVLDRLPPVQRRALEAALLLSEDEGPPPDQRTISTACLGVFRHLAEEERVLVAVDDVQWLDPPTALVLEFVARRLAEEPVGLLVAERVAGEGEAPLGLGRADLDVGRVRLGPLSTGALHRLLRDQLGVTLTRPALRRVHEASGGNPFYTLELVRALQAGGGRIQPGRPLPVPQTLEAILRERLEALPIGVREVLAAAAALSAANRVDPRRCAGAGAGSRGGHRSSSRTARSASAIRCSPRPPMRRSEPQSGGGCTAVWPKPSPTMRSGHGTWRSVPRSRARRSPVPSTTPHARRPPAAHRQRPRSWPSSPSA